MRLKTNGDIRKGVLIVSWIKVPCKVVILRQNTNEYNVNRSEDYSVKVFGETCGKLEEDKKIAYGSYFVL